MVLDMTLSGMGAQDICDRDGMDHMGIPVVFITGPTTPLIDMDYLNDVGGRVLPGPYSKKKLIFAIRELLQKQASKS